jgi:hypothetical protein
MKSEVQVVESRPDRRLMIHQHLPQRRLLLVAQVVVLQQVDEAVALLSGQTAFVAGKQCDR